MKNINVLWIVAAFIIICSCKKTKNATGSSAGFKVVSLGHTVSSVKAIRLVNGNFVVALHEVDNNNYGLLIGMDSTGKEIWKREFSSDLKRITDIQPLADSSFVIVSYDDTGVREIYLNCLTASGITKWSATRTINNLLLSVTSAIGYDGSINILAGVDGYNPGVDTPFMPYLIKYSSSGQLVSAKQISSPDTIQFKYPVMAASPDGFYVSSIYTVPFSRGNNSSGLLTLCLKMDINGNISWFQKQPDTAANFTCGGTTLCYSTTGNVVLAGTDDSDCPFSNYVLDEGNPITFLQGDLILFSLNGQTGDTLARNTFHLPGQSQRPLVIPSMDKGYLATATCNIYSNNSYYHFRTALIKTDANLNQQWQQIFSTPYPTYPFSVLQTSNGGFVVFGITQTFNQNQELVFIKTDENGNIK